MDEITNGQEVFIIFPAELFGLPLKEGISITRGKIINNTAKNFYNVEISFKDITTIQQFKREQLYLNINSATVELSKQLNPIKIEKDNGVNMD